MTGPGPGGSGPPAGPGDPASLLRRLEPVPTHRDRPATPASDLVGTDLSGRPVTVPVGGAGRRTLLLFLSAHCDGCGPLWGALADPAGLGGLEVVAVVDAPDRRARAAVRRLVARRHRRAVVASGEAFRAYRAHAPFFVLVVDEGVGDGPRVATEGVAWGLEQVVGDVARALPPAADGPGDGA